MAISIWQKQNGELEIVQLSEDVADGTPVEQCDYFKTLPYYQALTLFDADYQGTFPDPNSDHPDTWEWNGSVVVVNAAKQKEARNAAVLAQIAELERTELYPRGLREFMLEQPGAAQKPWYAKVKAVDDQVAVLRGQLQP